MSLELTAADTQKALAYFESAGRDRAQAKDDLELVLGWSQEKIESALNEVSRGSATTPFSQYRDYVSAIFRPGDTLCFVGIEHNRDRGKEHIENDFVSYETAISRDYFDELSRSNEHGSIYVATNTFPAHLIGQKTGRTQENVVEVRAVQADVDYNGATTIDAIQKSDAVPAPSIVVESSPDKFQGIWLVDGMAKDVAKPLMQAIAATFNTDSAVAEVARVMRVPGFVNRKYDSAPVARTLVQQNVRYTREQFRVEMPQAVEKKNADNWVKDVQIKHGDVYNQLIKLAGYYVREHNADDPDVLYALLAAHCANAVDRDGVTPFQCDLDKVRGYAEKWAVEFETKAQYEARTKLTFNQSQAAPVVPAAPIDVSNWRSMFRSVGEMEDGPIDMVIEGALQEGTCFIGANPGDGKTLVALSFAKSICTGTPLFGLPQFSVKTPRPVIYLIPESRDHAFRRRCESFQIPNDKTKFMARTISAGVALELSDPYLMQAVRETKAVVILDTASRFMRSTDENSAAQNRQLVNDVVALMAAGAVCVILIHHATKSAKTNGERMTLENMLRGTGDFGAMCDQAYGIRKDMTTYENGNGPMEIDLVNLKDREQIGGLTSLRLAASRKQEVSVLPVSYINETGNFRVVSDAESTRRETESLVEAVKRDPGIPVKELAARFRMTEYAVKSTLGRAGWHREKGGPDGASPWHQDLGGPCPYKKVPAATVAGTGKRATGKGNEVVLDVASEGL
jgi:hypothetical protein